MTWLANLVDRLVGERTESAPHEPDDSGADTQVVDFRSLVADVQDPNPSVRRDAAVLLSNLGVRAAVRPMLGSYMTYGDEFVLASLARFGHRLTAVAASEAREPSMGGRRLARLLRAVSATDDPTAMRLVAEHAAHPATEVHAAAAAGMARLGNHEGVALLRHDLESPEPERRLHALEALRSLPGKDAAAAVREHLDRYLGTAGALPGAIQVFAPFLIDRQADMARLLAERLTASRDSLNLATGPASGAIAEHHRGVVVRAARGWTTYYTTPRHSPDEQLAALEQARDAARAASGARVLLLGPIPSPKGRHPLRHVLTWLPANPYTVRLLFLGPTDYAVVMAWWHYLEDEAEVPTAMEVILDLVTLSSDRMTEEERILFSLVDDTERPRFARALLGHL